MAIALRAKPRTRHDLEGQMFFTFAEAPRKTLRAKTTQKVSGKPTATATTRPTQDTQDETLKDLCRLLHALAQKYTPRSAFDDYETLIQLTKILQEMTIPIAVAEQLQAPVKEHSLATVTRTPQYRLLRNRALAALATIADLSSKTPAKGCATYQRGMRAGFNYASDIAVFFLEDLEAKFDCRR